MKILEFGNKVNRKMLLIHGFQSPYQIWNRYIEHFEKDFHIIVPVIQGHDVDRKEDFTTFAENAKMIEDYVISNFGNKIYMVYGMSMGGILAAQLWQNQRLNFEHVVFDGTPLVSCNRILKKMLLNFYLDVTHKTQARDKKTVGQAVGTIISGENLDNFLAVLDNMTDSTIINCVNSVWSYRLPSDIDTPDTKLHFFHGTKINEIYAKKSAKYLKKHYPDTTIKCFNGKGHCENALINPNVMIEELSKIMI